MSTTKEILVITEDGQLGTRLIGFQGKECLSSAAELAREMQALGIISTISDIRMEGGNDEIHVEEMKDEQKNHHAP